MKVFITRRHNEQTKFIRILKEVLFARQVDVFVAEDGVSSGEYITTIIEKYIKNSDIVVALYPENSSTVSFELGIGVGAGRPVLIVTKQQDELPFDLRAYSSFQIDTVTKENISELASRIMTVAADSKTDPIDLKPIELENLVEKYFKEDGYNVIHADKDHDFGFDLIIEDPANGKRIAVETKSLSLGNRVSVGAASRLSASAAAIGAAAVMISTSGFTSAALTFGATRRSELALTTLDELKILKKTKRSLLKGGESRLVSKE